MRFAQVIDHRPAEPDADPDKIKFLVSISEERMHRAAAFLALKCGVVLPIVRNPDLMVALVGDKEA